MAEQSRNYQPVYPGTEGGPPAVFTLKLQKPTVNFAGQPIEEISFREPTAGDILKHGNPVKWSAFGEVDDISFRDDRMGEMLAELSGNTVLTIRRMHPQDYVSCCWGMLSFFLPAGLIQRST